ncbi:unnamed protein product [Ectocarpus sp. CCAP 1310/34]|nr:unnamed protein product [Ectocarpus sp. CCAP 1310/34]
MSLAAEKRRKAKALEEAGAALSVKLVARSTRGQRISELQGDDAEADETFWGQGAWQEEEDGDSEFSSEEDEPDKFDKDFNDSESEEEDDDGKEDNRLRKNERAAKRKQPGGVYKEPKTFAVKKRKTAPAAGAAGSSARGGGGSSGAAHGALSKRTVRASTKNKTEKSLEVREGEAKAREAQLKRSTPQRKKAIKGQFTQKQLLLEAIQTEQENMRWILKQRRLEDEAKEDEGRPKQHKILASRYASRRGCVDTIFFPDAYYLPPVLCQAPFSAGGGDGAVQDKGRKTGKSPSDRRCKITGAPAPYRDPLTGYYYANSAAFRETASGGGAGGGGASGTRVDGIAPAAAAAVSGVGAVVVGNGSLKGAGAGAGAGAAAAAAAGGGGGGELSISGAGKKPASSSAKEVEKKSKSSASKGKGKAKAGAGGTASTTASSTAAGAEKAKAGTKRKQAAGGKGAKPAKRPFFAPAGGGTAPSVLSPAAAAGSGESQQLVPLRGNNTAVIHYGSSPADTGSAPEGSAVVKAAAYAAVAAQKAAAAGKAGGGSESPPQGSAVVKAAAYAAVAAQAAAAAGMATAAAPVRRRPGTSTAMPLVAKTAAGGQPASKIEVEQPAVSTSTQLPQHQHLQASTAPRSLEEGVNGWEAGSNSASTAAVTGATNCTGWMQPVPAPAPLGQPPS